MAQQAAPNIDSQAVWAAFEYLVGEYEATGRLREDLIDMLAATVDGRPGQSRFHVQCRLAGALADRKALRFHAALRLAARLPVPQARAALLAMLTQPDLALWRPAEPNAFSGGGRAQTGRQLRHDLRPLAIAALGQLRDPSLLGLFHRLLEKLSSRPAEHQNLIAAVQWSLMNLAPGGSGEPMPAEMLSTRPTTGSDEAAESGVTGSASDAASTAEALRVVGAIPGPQTGVVARASEDRKGAGAGDGQAGGSQDTPSGASEREELLSEF